MARWGVSVATQIGNVTAYNTFQMTDVAEGGGPFASHAQRVFDAWGDNVMRMVSDEVQLVAVNVRKQDGTDEQEVTGLVEGTNGGGAAPPNVCIHIKKVSAGVSRSGRFFIPGAIESLLTATGQLTSGYRDICNTEMQNFLDDMIASNLQPTIDRLEDGGFASNIGSFSCKPFVGRQSRRLDRARS